MKQISDRKLISPLSKKRMFLKFQKCIWK